ncbi:hypothetical protein KJ766_01620 [Patescibacteria group bacterium]|nr:hypothetical protein [Patescibacteria group bacterium]
MFEAKDILFIVLAFCALWFTAFLCWFVYRAIVLIRGLHALLREVQFSFERVEQALNGIKSKFESGTGHLGSMAEALKDAVMPRK